MTTLARWTPRLAAALGGTAVLAAAAAVPAHASFLQELGSPFIVGSQPYGVMAADFSGDGRPDVIGLNGSSSTATMLTRLAGGGFALEAPPTEVAGGPSYGTVADFNRDGRLDFAVSGYNGTFGVSVHLRQAGTGFQSANGSPMKPIWVGAIAAADFNGDGAVDLVVSRLPEDGLTVLLQQPNGSFVAEGNPPATGDQPRFIATADFNADGRPDLAVSNIGSGTVTILLRKASGPGFDQEAGSPIQVGLQPVAVATSDFTGDGRQDLAVANFGSDTVSVLARQPGGGFSPLAGSPVPVGDGPYGVAAADFNGDGLSDLAAAGHASDNVTVMLRQAGGGFAPETGSPFPTDDGPNQVATADFNGDKKPDLAISNDQSNRLTVLLNTTPDPPAPQTPAAPGPAPVVNNPPAPAPVPAINARLVLSWSVTKSSVKVTSAILRDLPAGGATVKIACKTCKVSQTVTTKNTRLTLSKLRNKKLKRGASFTVTITKPGYKGLAFTRKVKNYGRTKAALRKAVRGPFTESRKCVPAAAGTTC